MTFREKLQKERPDCVGSDWQGGCMSCPKTYGYELYNECPCYPNDYVTDEETCRACWDREIPGTEPTKPSSNISLVDLIERAGTKKDISLLIYINGDDTTISIYPCPDPSEKQGDPVAEAYEMLLKADLDDIPLISRVTALLKEALE